VWGVSGWLLFHSYRSLLWSAVDWLGLPFPGSVGVGEFVDEVFKLGVKFPRESVSEMHSG
jgi:hypothetical protein